MSQVLFVFLGVVAWLFRQLRVRSGRSFGSLPKVRSPTGGDFGFAGGSSSGPLKKQICFRNSRKESTLNILNLHGLFQIGLMQFDDVLLGLEVTN